MSIADFHSHSTRSDGVLTPTALVRLAAGNGVRLLALTDHDSMEGIPEAVAAASEAGVRIIPSIEMSTDIPGDEAHVLGYFLDPEDADLQRTLAGMRDSRVARGEGMVRKLHSLGVEISWERVKEIAGDASVGRPHVAKALIEAGHVATFDEAFERYLGKGKPAYVERDKLTPENAVRFIIDHGGVPVLAHPREIDNLDTVLDSAVPAGLAALEVYYRSYTPADIQRLLQFATTRGILPLGGSDYHGHGSDGERKPGDIPLTEETIARFLDASGQRIGEARIRPYRDALTAR